MAGEDVETHCGEVARRIKRERESVCVCCTIDFSAFRLFCLYARVSLCVCVLVEVDGTVSLSMCVVA